jgi:hypothetical protein
LDGVHGVGEPGFSLHVKLNGAGDWAAACTGKGASKATIDAKRTIAKRTRPAAADLLRITPMNRLDRFEPVTP